MTIHVQQLISVSKHSKNIKFYAFLSNYCKSVAYFVTYSVMTSQENFENETKFELMPQRK